MKILGLIWAGPAFALSLPDLEARGFEALDCRFDQRCVIGQPCERAWRDMRWMVHVADGAAYRVRREGRIGRKLPLMQDARWKGRSEALAILSPMREAVAGHLTVFDGGGAIYTLQYAGAPGAGQVFLGTCKREKTG